MNIYAKLALCLFFILRSVMGLDLYTRCRVGFSLYAVMGQVRRRGGRDKSPNDGINGTNCDGGSSGDNERRLQGSPLGRTPTDMASLGAAKGEGVELETTMAWERSL